MFSSENQLNRSSCNTAQSKVLSDINNLELKSMIFMINPHAYCAMD